MVQHCTLDQWNTLSSIRQGIRRSRFEINWIIIHAKNPHPHYHIWQYNIPLPYMVIRFPLCSAKREACDTKCRRSPKLPSPWLPTATGTRPVSTEMASREKWAPQTRIQPQTLWDQTHAGVSTGRGEGVWVFETSERVPVVHVIERGVVTRMR